MSAYQRVVIIGAGYAGVMAANRLAGSKSLAGQVQVTVVNPHAEFIERIRLHEVAAGSRESAAVPMASLLNPAAAVVVGTAARIDPHARLVQFADGRDPLAYDLLVYAVGSASATAGAGSEGYGVQSAQEAARLRIRLEQLNAGAVVTVVGGGLTGIETASEIAERHPRLRVRLVSKGGIGADLSTTGRRELQRTLRALGVELVENTEVENSGEGQLTTSSGARLESDCTVWTAGFSTPDLARASGLPIDPDGRLLVDETLSVPEFPEIFGAGDAVRPPDSVAAHLRMSCAAAMPMGAHAADNIIARLERRAPQVFSNGFLARCISLGRTAGLIQFVHADDRPRPLAIGRQPGAFLKEQVCRLALRWMRNELRRSGSYSWPKGPRAAQPQLAEAR
ncbi:NAD(P)/FAD-dependent oxidoreductase [Arthrobacter sp. VKM Ac-2550]|uniref:NAD(P)/FAD-dependent oxidoreductase n=1 Tax=Crystallibacter permensis TaxID=1938888 RepID=UPI002226ABF6|nr:FAD-dependent oxidoreductase [Arthrobacter sp. VKM Ac-2550]MCW2133093.1 NADH dehydrogenase, FAD-containing subunit [Arthrobacter sp. VKM Ac-2550]